MRFLAAAVLLVAMSLEAQSPVTPTPPVAKLVPKTDTLHGDVRTDPWFWMRDKTNPEVIRYLEAENAHRRDDEAHRGKREAAL